MRYLNAQYDLGDGTVLHDLDGACRQCGKRLTEVINDPSRVWRKGQIVCIDCGTTHAPPDLRCECRDPKSKVRCFYRPAHDHEHGGVTSTNRLVYWKTSA